MDKAVSEDLHALATPEKLEHIRRNWRVKRVGWVVLAILVLAGAAGLFGDGPLSSTIRSANGLTLEFDRFVRRERPFTLKLNLVPPPGWTSPDSVESHLLILLAGAERCFERCQCCFERQQHC